MKNGFFYGKLYFLQRNTAQASYHWMQQKILHVFIYEICDSTAFTTFCNRNNEAFLCTVIRINHSFCYCTMVSFCWSSQEQSKSKEECGSSTPVFMVLYVCLKFIRRANQNDWALHEILMHTSLIILTQKLLIQTSTFFTLLQSHFTRVIATPSYFILFVPLFFLLLLSTSIKKTYIHI